MMLKHLLIVLTVLIAFSCEKPGDPTPTSFLLTTVEWYHQPDTLLANPRFADTVRAYSTDEYRYDSKNLISERRLLDRNKRHSWTYKVERDADERIVRITYKKERMELTGSEYVETFTWAGDSIFSKRVYSTGEVYTIVHGLNQNRLPIYKRFSSEFSSNDGLGVEYDANGNVSALLGLVSPPENYEFDPTVFNPYTCTYDLRLFNSLGYSPELFLPFLTMSRNWIIKRNNGPVEKVVKTNSTSYPTETITASHLSGYSTMIRYKYNK